MSPSRNRKNTIVWKKRPAGVGQPPCASVMSEPNSICVTLKVSGFAIKKNTRAE
jgi:hypothetical protein